MDLADPTIAMQVRPLGGQQMANPFEMMSQFANAQRSMVEVQNARQMLAAKQRAGQLISGSKTMEEAQQKILADPLASGFASEFIPLLQGAATSKTQQAGMQQEQATSGFNSLMQAITTAGVVDPKSIPQAAAARMALMNPTTRAASQQGYDAVIQALGDGLNEPEFAMPANADEATKQQVFAARRNKLNLMLAGFGVGAGAQPQEYRDLIGAVAPTMQVIPGAGPGGADAVGKVGSENLTAKPMVTLQSGAAPSFLTPDQKAAQQALGTQEADTSKAMSEAAEMAPVQLHNIGMLEDAMKVVKTGGGAVGRSALASTAQMLQQAGINIPDSAISELANGKEGEVDGLPASQFIKNALRTMALGNLRTDQAGLGKAYAMEINSAIDSLDNNSDPKTIQTILNKVRYATELQNDRSSKYFNEYYKARQANEVGPNSGADYYNHNFLDDFNKKFEKEHPGVIGAKLPQAKPEAKKKLSDKEQEDLINSALGAQ